MLEGLKRLGYQNPLLQIMQLDKAHHEHYEIMLNDSYNTVETLKGLKQLGYMDPLSTAVEISPPTFKDFLQNHYYTFETVKGLSKLEYKETLKLFLSLEPEQIKLLSDMGPHVWNKIKEK
ncbi:hypothetical protein TUM19329_15220 [Legionella antarctica]|uniref:Uncharacterized protein n=1 Tax=Legionella antarctica TaxID=2708020 RepID=A0A6F8T3W9_9GAMM|nr:hypothetical protein [Legionella antarctica]BCA95161.1 hypothetical protein TUM19329_15220 [Legionella antarctica]